MVISLALEGGMDEPSARRLLRAARRQAHQHEDETAGVTVVGEGPISTSEGVQWVDKYRPRMPGLVRPKSMERHGRENWGPSLSYAWVCLTKLCALGI